MRPTPHSAIRATGTAPGCSPMHRHPGPFPIDAVCGAAYHASMADEHATRHDDTLRGPRCAATFRTASVDEAVAAVEVMYGAHALLLDTRQGLDLRFAGFNVGAL